MRARNAASRVAWPYASNLSPRPASSALSFPPFVRDSRYDCASGDLFGASVGENDVLQGQTSVVASLSPQNRAMTYRGLANPWRHRHFVVQAVRGEIKRQFARSSLGASWLVLHPLARSAVFAFVFSEILVVKLPGVSNVYGYAIYLTAGMAAWSLFNDIITRCCTVFTEYASILKKVPVSHFCMPAIACGGALVSHGLLLVATAAALTALGAVPGVAWLALIPALAILTMLGISLGLILGIFSVFKHDVAQLTGIVLQLWFWMTPIVYAQESLPHKIRWVADINPMTPLVRIYQDAMVRNRLPEIDDFLIPLFLAAALTSIAIWLLHRASADIVDAL